MKIEYVETLIQQGDKKQTTMISIDITTNPETPNEKTTEWTLTIENPPKNQPHKTPETAIIYVGPTRNLKTLLLLAQGLSHILKTPTRRIIQSQTIRLDLENTKIPPGDPTTGTTTLHLVNPETGDPIQIPVQIFNPDLKTIIQEIKQNKKQKHINPSLNYS